jgi:hypothetical protein
MEQWYKDGEVFNSLTAIRNKMKEVSLPMLLTDSIVDDLGFIKVVDVKPTITNTQYIVEGGVELVLGVPTKVYAVIEKTAEQIQAEQTQAMQVLIQHFTDVTTAYIEARVTAYNQAHGLAFADIDAFTKYAINPLSQHYVIANQFINYADAVWKAVRDYQAIATIVPTDVEFKVILDAVVF